jgi:hypothetical protein
VREAGVVEGTTTGKKVGFIQMKPNCAEGFVYSENENNCVAAPVKAEGDDKPEDDKPKNKNKNKNKKKKKQHDDDDEDDDDDNHR